MGAMYPEDDPMRPGYEPPYDIEVTATRVPDVETLPLLPPPAE